jgi:hypothetical protein
MMQRLIHDGIFSCPGSVLKIGQAVQKQPKGTSSTEINHTITF